MAATVLVKDVLWSVSTLLQDTSDQFDRWTQDELVRWLDDAQLAIVKYLPLAGSGIFSVRLQPGSLQSIERFTPAKIRRWNGNVPTADVLGLQFLKPLHNMGADGVTPGEAIRVIKGDSLEACAPNWRATRGTKVRQVIFDPAFPLTFEVVPAVHDSTPVWIRLGMTTYPTKVAADGDYSKDSVDETTLTVADEFREEVINYMVARANMKDSEFSDGNKASYFAGLFTSTVNAKAEAMIGYNPNLTRLPFAPEPMAAAK